jgi:hypothetical protein
MKWGLICKPNVKKTVSLTLDISKFLQENDVTILAEEEFAKAVGIEGYTLK